MRLFTRIITTISIIILSTIFIINPTFRNTHINSGNKVEDLIAVAETQIGYTEGTDIEDMSGWSFSDGNFTKYGQWYGINPGAWCAMFVSWCADQAEIPTSVIPSHASCDIGMNYFKEHGNWGWGGYWAVVNGYTEYKPVRGDIVYFGNGNLEDSNHVGIVYKVDEKNIYTIEGNKSNTCKYQKYSLYDEYIYGYGHPEYNQE